MRKQDFLTQGCTSEKNNY